MWRTTALRLTCAAALALAIAPVSAQDEPKPPKDSVQLIVTGCLNKRVLNATRVEPEEMNVKVRDFSLSGKKDVMGEVKARDKQGVTVTGWVRKIDLTEPGLKIGGSRVRIGPATSGDPMRPPSMPEQERRLVTMEALKVEPALAACR